MGDPNKARKLRRTWPQRLLILFNTMCIVGALATAGALGYSNKQLTEINRVNLTGAIPPSRTHKPGTPLNYLLVGADTSAGLAPGDPVNRGRQDSADTFRTDTIMVLRIDPNDATARILSFPRDLWVPIPGRSKNRINSAVEDGGALKLIETIKADFGIPIDHYVQVDFAGFKDLVNTIGGVPVYFSTPVRAIHSTPFKIPDAGCFTLDGNQALDFVRIRKDYQVYRDGRWRTDLSGDYGRISRQQFFLQATLKRAISKGIRNPSTLSKLIDLGIKSVKIDDQLKTEDLVDLGKRFRNFKPENLVKYSIPADDAVHGGAQVLEMRANEAEPLLAIFRGTSTPTTGNDGSTPAITSGLSPSAVSVQVQNGGHVSGQAREVTNAFRALGFSTLGAGDAPPDFTGVTTLVSYGPGKLAEARYVARFISNPVVFAEVPDQTDVDVVVTIAPDWKGTLSVPKPDNQVTVPSTTVATTAPVATTVTTAPLPTTTIVGDVPELTPSCG